MCAEWRVRKWHSPLLSFVPGEFVSDQEERRQKVEEARKYLDAALTDDGVHIVMVSMQDETKTMAVHIINTVRPVATQLLQVAAMYTAETPDNETMSKAH